jgi:hypothetical protein
VTLVQIQLISVRMDVKEQLNQESNMIINLNFGQALEAVKQNNRIARAGWNGKGMYLSLVLAGQWQVSKEVPGMSDPKLLTVPWIGMKTADDKFVPWLASQTDVLAEDWCILN